jgi:hypothetical protein
LEHSCIGNHVHLVGNDLPVIVFSDDPRTKLHDLVPRVLFRFEILLKLCEARELAWVAHFFPWVLLNEGMSRKQIDTYDQGLVPDGVHSSDENQGNT